MNDNDLIKRGNVRNEIRKLSFNPLVNELLYRVLDSIKRDTNWRSIGEIPPDDKTVILACRHKGCSSGYYYSLGYYDFYQSKWKCLDGYDDEVLFWAFPPDFPEEA